MKSAHEMVAEKANQDLKLNHIEDSNITHGHYKYKGKLVEQIRLSSPTPQSLKKAKQVLNYLKWKDLGPTLAAGGDGL